ncbi:hypothetical protein [Vibrio owensii]|uniref:hypothetical protein n=1 Tax=Vibrio owensii TaxID=696485 RepID=UPI0018F23F95|nr:hypothetical protein [Vibrio owensii]
MKTTNFFRKNKYFICLVILLLIFANASRLIESSGDSYWDVYPIIHNDINETSRYEVLSIDGQESSKTGQLGDLYICLKRYKFTLEPGPMKKSTTSSEIELLVDGEHEVLITLRDGRTWRMLFKNSSVSGIFYLDCNGRYFDGLLE